MPMLTPQSIVAGRYQIRSLLGQGGMGKVYRAHHLALHRDVALKIIGGDVIGNLEARFEREARAAGRLDHPGCVRIFDYGRTPDHAQYIAMELVEGATLARVLATEGRLSTRRAVRVARAVLGALVHAHGRGVLHRDVKPENIMLVDGPVPRCVLIDFGLADLLDDKRLTVAGLCFGSPSYLAPERLLGRVYDARADIYSVGVVLYEMLAGERPFQGKTAQEIMHARLTRPARPLRAIRPDVSPALEAIIMRALERDASRRFEAADEMLAALEDVPALDELAARRSTAARAEQEPTTAVAEVVWQRPSLPRRMWTWICFGSWRWREKVGAELLGSEARS